MNQYFIIILLYALYLSKCSDLMNENEFVEKLLYLVEQNSTYTSAQGDNLLLWKNGQFHCDCSGLIKAVLNGFDIYNVKEGDKLSGFPLTGDKNSQQLIDSCTDVSTEFNLLKYSGPRFLYFPGHIGVYIGKEVQCGANENEICNVVECTSSWDGGIQLSYVNSFGKRYNKKDGKSENNWEKNGLPTLWIQYNCKNINPNQASDCVLSPNDKNSYKYCCFEKNYFISPYKCVPYNQSSYIERSFEFDLIKDTGLGDIFECNPKSEGIGISPESSDCQSIHPKKSSDCMLSANDQKYFKYCCYEEIEGIDIECGAYTQESYEKELYAYNLLSESNLFVFKCNTDIKGSANFESISYINLSVIALILFLF